MKARAPATLKDVAVEARVSPTAVSRYLNHRIVLPKATRDRIDAAIAKLDYRPNILAKRLSLGRSEAIGLVTPEIANPFYAELAAAIEAEAGNHGYSVHLIATGGDRRREAEILRRLKDHFVDGLIMMTNQPDDGTLAALLTRHDNVVLLDEDIPGVDVPKIFVENESGAYLATRCLIDAGHTDIALVSGPEGLFTVNERLHGFQRAMREKGLDARPERVLLGQYTRQFGEEAGRRLIGMEKRPTAIFACSDYLAIGIYLACREAGLRVPDDISIVGFDDMPLAFLVDPPLTTVRQPVAEMGRLAVRQLFARFGAPDAPTAIRLPVELVSRHSVAKPRRDDLA